MNLPSNVKENVVLSPHTTISLGGKARYFSQCTKVDHIRENLRWAYNHGVPIQLLGGGSNIIFPDDGYDGLVLRIALQGTTFATEGVTVASGETWDKVVEASVKRGLAGLECLSGIPGQVGATPIQNVGAYGQEVSETILWIDALDRKSLEIIRIPGCECGFEYRQSRFKNSDFEKYVVTSVHYKLRPNGKPTVSYPELKKRVDKKLLNQSGTKALSAIRKIVLSLRRNKSMLIDSKDPLSRSVGSFFVNPVIDSKQAAELKSDHPELPQYPSLEKIKIPAAWLVEHAGFEKGFRYGGVGISDRHALSIVNFNGSTKELLKLADKIRNSVISNFGIELQFEPVVVSIE